MTGVIGFFLFVGVVFFAWIDTKIFSTTNKLTDDLDQAIAKTEADKTNPNNPINHVQGHPAPNFANVIHSLESLLRQSAEKKEFQVVEDEVWNMIYGYRYCKSEYQHHDDPYFFTSSHSKTAARNKAKDQIAVRNKVKNALRRYLTQERLNPEDLKGTNIQGLKDLHHYLNKISTSIELAQKLLNQDAKSTNELNKWASRCLSVAKSIISIYRPFIEAKREIPERHLEKIGYLIALLEDAVQVAEKSVDMATEMQINNAAHGAMSAFSNNKIEGEVSGLADLLNYSRIINELEGIDDKLKKNNSMESSNSMEPDVFQMRLQQSA